MKHLNSQKLFCCILLMIPVPLLTMDEHDPDKKISAASVSLSDTHRARLMQDPDNKRAQEARRCKAEEDDVAYHLLTTRGIQEYHQHSGLPIHLLALVDAYYGSNKLTLHYTVTDKRDKPCVSFNDSGHQIILVVGNVIRLLDAQTKVLLHTLDEHRGRVSQVVYNNDDSQIASGSWDTTIKLWDSYNGQCIRTFLGHSNIVLSLAFSQDNAHLISSSKDKTIKIWAVVSGTCMRTLQERDSIPQRVSFNPDDSQIITSMNNGSIKSWSSDTGTCLSILPVKHNGLGGVIIFDHNSSPFLNVAISSDDDRALELWSLPTAKLLKTLNGHAQKISLITFNSDGSLIASVSAAENTIKLWDSETGTCLYTMICPAKNISSVAFNKQDNSLIVATIVRDTGIIKLWSNQGNLMNAVIEQRKKEQEGQNSCSIL